MNMLGQGELISAIADGEVQPGALDQGLQAIEADPQWQSTWETYHLIGDVLRSSDLATPASSEAFLARLRPALAQEAVLPVGGRADSGGTVVGVSARTAANDGSYRWKMVAGLASIAAVLAVGWNVVNVGTGSAEQPQLAVAPTQPAAVLASRAGNVMLRDPRLDELLAAHRQFGGATAIQMPSGAVRNAVFEAPGR